MSHWHTRFSRSVFALAVVLTTSATFLAPAAAQTQPTRLESIENFGGQYWSRFSLNGGSTWSGWSWVPSYSEDYSTTYSFVGPISVVSPRTGLLVAAAKTIDGALLYSTFMPPQGWDVWRQLPGTSLGGQKFCLGLLSIRCFFWNADSYPVLSTRGPGLVELFIVANQDSFHPQPGDGQINLVHTWSDRIVGPSVEWSENWESLGTGLLKGSPAAISWGPGRTDVLVVGGGDSLYHKWFADGRWSRGWEALGGGPFTSSPTVDSMGPGHLDIYVVGPGQMLWHTWHNINGWGFWESNIAVQVGPFRAPAATSRGPGNVELFSYYPSGQLFQRTYNNGTWTERLTWTGGINAATVYWTPAF